ncbi:hypothetical protein EVAR_95580_1 [Eumeta japonica]|uniref:Uncharacterized protein n=1 Tax=Eumeta variegata TaxID=151549 RepID=A0A4C1VKA2_EUMVA|nr:hypothetical protein EVAR_95580_1 [Eumeta japonica]
MTASKCSPDISKTCELSCAPASDGSIRVRDLKDLELYPLFIGPVLVSVLMTSRTGSFSFSTHRENGRQGKDDGIFLVYHRPTLLQDKNGLARQMKYHTLTINGCETGASDSCDEIPSITPPSDSDFQPKSSSECPWKAMTIYSLMPRRSCCPLLR